MHDETWPIHEVAKLAGTTSRTLRHYDEVGLLAPTRVAANGTRSYDAPAITRLQRILLLRELGIGIPAIAAVLERETDTATALGHHREWLLAEQDRIARQLASVERTIDSLRKGHPMTAKDMLDGFDHTQYKEEVEQRWGREAYADSDRWWRSMTEAERTDWKARQAQLAADWRDAAERGVDPTSAEAAALAERHANWLASIPGTPGYGTGAPTLAYLVGLADMYVADDRFAANYGGAVGAMFVRDAITHYAEHHLTGA